MVSKLANQCDIIFAVGDFKLQFHGSSVPNVISIENNDLLNNIFDVSFYQSNSVCNNFGKVLELTLVSDTNKSTIIRSEPIISLITSLSSYVENYY